MGFKRKSDTLKITFAEDHEFYGLEVEFKKPTIGDVIDFEKFKELEDSPGPEQVKEFIATVAKFLVSWNLEDENDQPVPATYEGLLTQDIEFLGEITATWMEAATQASGDLGKGSTAGEHALLGSMTMETL